MNKCKNYSIHKIPKRRPGEFRKIFNPSQPMREIQYRLLHHVLAGIPVDDYVWAFEPGKSIPQMARLHVNKDVVLAFDIKDFFQSIHSDLLSEIFSAYGYVEKANRTISELCTYKFFVPQGALTSPKISNIVTSHTFGPDIKRFADSIGATVTIYADDITLSLNMADYQATLGGVEGKPLRDLCEDIKREVTRIVNRWGFRINCRKTKTMTRISRQYVCGSVVNTKPNLLRKQRELLRAVVRNVVTNGVASEAAKMNQSPKEFLSTLCGKLNWYQQLNPDRAGPLVSKLSEYISNNPLTDSAG